jgi:hypothetical protein
MHGPRLKRRGTSLLGMDKSQHGRGTEEGEGEGGVQQGDSRWSVVGECHPCHQGRTGGGGGVHPSQASSMGRTLGMAGASCDRHLRIQCSANIGLSAGGIAARAVVPARAAYDLLAATQHVGSLESQDTALSSPSTECICILSSASCSSTWRSMHLGEAVHSTTGTQQKTNAGHRTPQRTTPHATLVLHSCDRAAALRAGIQPVMSRTTLAACCDTFAHRH